MTPPKAPNYFLKCYIVMLATMVLCFAIVFLGMTLALPGQIEFIPLESRARGFIMAVFAPAMISIAFTVFHFERRVTA